MGFKGQSSQERANAREGSSLTFPTAVMPLGPGLFSELGGKKHLNTHTLTSLSSNYWRKTTMSVSCTSLFRFVLFFEAHTEASHYFSQSAQTSQSTAAGHGASFASCPCTFRETDKISSQPVLKMPWTNCLLTWRRMKLQVLVKQHHQLTWLRVT